MRRPGLLRPSMMPKARSRFGNFAGPHGGHHGGHHHGGHHHGGGGGPIIWTGGPDWPLWPVYGVPPVIVPEFVGPPPTEEDLEKAKKAKKEKDSLGKILKKWWQQ